MYRKNQLIGQVYEQQIKCEYKTISEEDIDRLNLFHDHVRNRYNVTSGDLYSMVTFCIFRFSSFQTIQETIETMNMWLQSERIEILPEQLISHNRDYLYFSSIKPR